jgi:hypothetical protein
MTMPTLTESVEAEVPVAFANREWTQFMTDSFFARRQAARDEYGDGVVTFEPAGEGSTKVTVELQYEPKKGSGSEEDIAGAREHLEKTLEGYRAFVVKRCDETHCWKD